MKIPFNIRDNRYCIEICVKICRQKIWERYIAVFINCFLSLFDFHFLLFLLFSSICIISLSSMFKSLWFLNNLLYLQYWSPYFLSLVLDGLFLHDICTENKQCTGTENANVCTTYGNKTLLTCRCSDEYMEIKSKCYKSKISIPSCKALKVLT